MCRIVVKHAEEFELMVRRKTLSLVAKNKRSSGRDVFDGKEENTTPPQNNLEAVQSLTSVVVDKTEHTSRDVEG